MNVFFKTTLGDFTLELDNEKCPTTVKNFLYYVENKFYIDTIFHRVIKGFMIQGGGFDENMIEKKTNDPIQNEAKTGVSNLKYTISMARTSEPHSATSQFFINSVDNLFLYYTSESPQGYGYCAFGTVIDDTSTIDKISNVATQSMFPHDDVPVEPVIILDANIL